MATIGIRLQRADHECAQRFRHRRSRRYPQLPSQGRPDGPHDGVGLERGRAVNRLVEQHAQSPNVRARRLRLRPQLLRRHVTRSPEELAGLRGLGRLLELAGYTDVRERCRATASGRTREEDVGRLHVSVHDAVSVQGLEATGDIGRDFGSLRQGKGPLFSRSRRVSSPSSITRKKRPSSRRPWP